MGARGSRYLNQSEDARMYGTATHNISVTCLLRVRGQKTPTLLINLFPQFVMLKTSQ